MHKTKVNSIVRERTRGLEKDTEHLTDELQGLKVVFETSRENRVKTLASGIWRSGTNGPIINYAKNVYGKEDKGFGRATLENVKFLKYENSQNLGARQPAISKEEKALKEFIKQSRSSKKKPLIKGTRCGQCEGKIANVNCVECGEDYCASCFVVFHLKGNLKKHRSRPIGVENLTPRQDVLERNMASFPDKKHFKTMEHGKNEHISSSSHLHQRTHSNCSTVSNNNNSLNDNNNNNSSNVNSFNNSNNDKMQLQLLRDGNFDEEESSLSFQRALQSWRDSNKGSGDSSDVSMQNRNVRAVPSHEIAVGTMSTSVATTSNLDDLMQDLDKKIQGTSSLAYSDKLMLKKLRRNEFSTSFTNIPKSNSSFMSIISDIGEADKENLSGNNFSNETEIATHSSSNLSEILNDLINKKEFSDDTSSNNQSNKQESKPDDRDYDGGGVRKTSIISVEEMHSSVPTPRMFPTKIKPTLKKCDESEKFLDTRKALSDFNATSKKPESLEILSRENKSDKSLKITKDVKNVVGKDKMKSKTKKKKDVLNPKRKHPEDHSHLEANFNKTEFKLNLPKDFEDNFSDRTPVTTSRTTAKSTKENSSRSKIVKTSSRIVSRLMSARLASERGGFTKKISEALSNIASMDVDENILVETSLDNFYMAGLSAEEFADQDQQTSTNFQQISARSHFDGKSEDGFKISNHFYRIKQKTWKPNSQNDDDDCNEMIKNLKEVVKQIDDNLDNYHNGDDDDCLEGNIRNNIEDNFISDDKKLVKCDFSLADDKSNSNLSECEPTPPIFMSEEEMIMKFYNSVRDEPTAEENSNLNSKHGFNKKSFGFSKDRSDLILGPGQTRMLSPDVRKSASKNNILRRNASSPKTPKNLKISNSPRRNLTQSVNPPLHVTGSLITPATPGGRCSSKKMSTPDNDCLENKFEKNYLEKHADDNVMKVHHVGSSNSSLLSLGYNICDDGDDDSDDDDDHDNDDAHDDDHEEDEDDGFSIGRTSSMISHNEESGCETRDLGVQSQADPKHSSQESINDCDQHIRHINDFDESSLADQESEDMEAVLSLR